MADKISNGTYRWNKSFRDEFWKPMKSQYVENQIGESTIQGHKKFSDESEIKETLDPPKPEFRMRKRKEPRQIDGNSEEVEKVADVAERRADITSGGYDTEKTNTMLNDSELTKPEKEYQKSMEAEANNMNYSSQSGNFQGGWNRVNALKTKDFGSAKKAMSVEDNVPKFRLVSRQKTSNTKTI